MKLLLILLAIALSIASPPLLSHADQSFFLDWPLACELGKTCFIQNYVDHDPSDRTLDFRCGHRTYDGHDGTDIRLPDLDSQKKGVEVFAAASGQVSHTRGDMEDVSVRVIGKLAVEGRECGNGVLIKHESGWITQYCHLAKGSIRVTAGQRVRSGEVIGLVGLSGNTEFPHLHLTVRYNGTAIDPFDEGSPPNSCGAGRTLWSARVMSQLRYPTEIINVGFADRAVTMDMIERGEIKPPDSHSPAIVAYVRAVGLQAEDEQTIELSSPDGHLMADYRTTRLVKDQAQYFISAGKKLVGSGWDSGTYTATFVLRRSGLEVERKIFRLKMTD